MGEQGGQGRILLVDDDKGLLRLIKVTLEAVGFEVETASNGQEGLRKFHLSPPDLVVLDVMMPGMSGIEVCQEIREQSTVPILFLTARGHVQDLVEGLNAGADDYLVKPFNVQELQARIEALLRRARMPHDPQEVRVLRFGNGELVINRDAHQVFVRGRPVHLTPTEYRLLLYMAERAGRILSVDTLYNAVWSYESDADPKIVRWYIWRLRQKVEPNPDEPRYITTEPGIGYRFSTT